MTALDVKVDARDSRGGSVSAWDLCLLFGEAPQRIGAEAGVLCKPTHGNTIRLSPPLTISEMQVKAALNIIEACLEHVMKR
jgi:ornithine--oxo-acid transaminase